MKLRINRQKLMVAVLLIGGFNLLLAGIILLMDFTAKVYY